MAHPYAHKMQGAAKAKAMCKADGGPVRMAGDLIDVSDNFRNIRESNSITRSLDRANQVLKPKAPVTTLPVIKIAPDSKKG